MGQVLRALILALIVAIFALGVAWLFCAGLSDVFPGGPCGRVLTLGAQVRVAVAWIAGTVAPWR